MHFKLLFILLLLVSSCGFLVEPNENSADEGTKIKSIEMIYEEVDSSIYSISNNLVYRVDYNENGKIFYPDVDNITSDSSKEYNRYSYDSLMISEDSTTLLYNKELSLVNGYYSDRFIYYKPTLHEILIKNMFYRTHYSLYKSLIEYDSDEVKSDVYLPREYRIESENGYRLLYTDSYYQSTYRSVSFKSNIIDDDISFFSSNIGYNLRDYVEEKDRVIKKRTLFGNNDNNTYICSTVLLDNVVDSLKISSYPFIDFRKEGNTSEIGMYADDIKIPLHLAKKGDNYILKTLYEDTIKYVFSDSLYLKELYQFIDGSYKLSWNRLNSKSSGVSLYNCSGDLFYGGNSTVSLKMDLDSLIGMRVISATTEERNQHYYSSDNNNRHSEILRKEYHYKNGREDIVKYFVNDKHHGNLRYYYEFW